MFGQFRSVPGDPYWTCARFDSTCSGCKRPVRKGHRIFFYPKDKSVFCSECGKKAERDFRSMAEQDVFPNG